MKASLDRADRTSARRAQILDAALRCFTERGYTETSMEDIRRASGASIGSIYHHFGGKEQLAVALHRTYLERWWRLSSKALKPGRGASDAVKDLIVSYLRWIEREPGLFRFMFYLPESINIRTFAREELAAEFHEGNRLVWDWLQEQSAKGAIRRLPMDLYQPVLLGPVLEHAGRWLRGVADTHIRKAAPLLAEGIWRSLRPDRSR